MAMCCEPHNTQQGSLRIYNRSVLLPSSSNYSNPIEKASNSKAS